MHSRRAWKVGLVLMSIFAGVGCVDQGSTKDAVEVSQDELALSEVCESMDTAGEIATTKSGMRSGSPGQTGQGHMTGVDDENVSSEADAQACQGDDCCHTHCDDNGCCHTHCHADTCINGECNQHRIAHRYGQKACKGRNGQYRWCHSHCHGDGNCHAHCHGHGCCHCKCQGEGNCHCYCHGCNDNTCDPDDSDDFDTEIIDDGDTADDGVDTGVDVEDSDGNVDDSDVTTDEPPVV